MALIEMSISSRLLLPPLRLLTYPRLHRYLSSFFLRCVPNRLSFLHLFVLYKRVDFLLGLFIHVRKLLQLRVLLVQHLQRVLNRCISVVCSMEKSIGFFVEDAQMIMGSG
jgi:hypothetical protein